MLWSPRGFTTAEFLSAALCGTLVLVAFLGFYREQLFRLLLEESRTATLEDARGALDIMARELRNAGLFPMPTDVTCVKDESGKPLRVVSASPTSIQIQTDTQSPSPTSGDPDGKCTATGESVTYAIGSGTDVCPGPMTIKRNGNCLVANVVVSSKEPLFTYFDLNDVQLGGNPPLDAVKRIRIRFSVVVPDPTPRGKSLGKTIKSTLSSSVEFRNS
jgi:hypothetical protein